MTRNKLVKVIFDKCKNKEGLTRRQGEIVNCFESIAEFCFNEHTTWEKVLRQEIKGFVYNNDYSQLEEIFKGV